MMIMKKGDIIQAAKEGKFDVIIHGCNCFNTFGAGLAKSIKKEFPKAYATDCDTVKGDKNKLGTFSVGVYKKFHVVNAYTQFGYGKQGVNLDYDALHKCLKAIKEIYFGRRIGMPKIGCGLAGGDWSLVKQIIDMELENEDVTIMYL